MRRMIEIQHAVQYGYRLLHPTDCTLPRLLNKHIAGLLDNPDKVQGKKAKPVYSDRQRKIAQRIKTLQG
ncbi:MAG: hypothetical protein PHH59_14715 [Methylovulum sp.]|uniref:hypothetical protein n=1 Tax=Methylovulum sp. TaxID=1916980 RepID=UPI00260B6D4F|nr:hypothetical protein [Methylovulum sp.]MDD2725258.1 hypothetical protein [Methylovulum sp.]